METKYTNMKAVQTSQRSKEWFDLRLEVIPKLITH
jgi:hypothetical protein